MNSTKLLIKLSKWKAEKSNNEGASMLNYWREQEFIKQQAKVLEKEIENKNGKKYIDWVNQFTDKMENEFEVVRDKVHRQTGQGSSIRALELKNRLLGSQTNASSTENLSKSRDDGQNYLTSKPVGNEMRQSLNESADQILNSGQDHKRYLNEFNSKNKIRERKYKNEYAMQLRDQIIHKKNLRDREFEMDPIQKAINMKYVNSLLTRQNTEHNPILGTSGTFNEALEGKIIEKISYDLLAGRKHKKNSSLSHYINNENSMQGNINTMTISDSNGSTGFNDLL